jgi:outer membrane receptor protein involved in Fe transport
VASDLTSAKDELETLGSNGTIQYNLNDNLTFKSVTGLVTRHGQVRSDLDYTELNLAQATINAGGSRQKALSQEFQLTGSAMDDKLNFVVGLFGFRENNQDRDFGGLAVTAPLFFTINSRVRLDPNNLSNGADNTIAFDPANQTNPADPTNRSAFRENMALFPNAQAFMLNAGPLGIVQRFAVPGAITQTIRDVDNKSYAAYSQATYDITDRLAFTAGLRFTAERKRVAYKIIAETPGVVGANVRRAQEVDFQFERSTRFNDWSPMANLSFQATDDFLMYANFSKGFKSGGFNGRANADPRANPPTPANPNPADLTQEIDDEKVTAYEVGFKSSFLDKRLVLNVAGYWNIYQDIQLTIPSGGNAQAQILILNAGENIIKGAEVEIRALPFSGLELTAALGVANSRYTEFDDPRNLRATDRNLQGFPNYTGNFAASYLVSLGNMGDLRPRIEWTHRGRQGTDVVFSRELRRNKNGELDATIGWALADGKTEFVLFGKNLLNREFFVNGVNLGDSLGHAYRFYNDPRTYGLEVRRSF